ncbi:hypothetical protein [Gordonia tangerina]|uniref:Uncharacterized protein n=1 Tax=Gordonia tangerina TaxID=2911060 RepID=A0ABS9DDD2_9ACTN|nr:hypothetical protein [Gordonia tangerina]MCF3937191.1 hypothetical protein [Gordonia tangerina]
MKTRTRLAAAALVVGSAATIATGITGAGQASAQVNAGKYIYTTSAPGSARATWVVTGNAMYPVSGQKGSLSDPSVNPFVKYALHQSRNGGWADNGVGGRIVLRAKGNGYVGEAYFLGIKTADVRLTPKR